MLQPRRSAVKRVIQNSENQQHDAGDSKGKLKLKFEAALLITTLSLGQKVFNDTRGPYLTEKRCQARVVEMQESAIELMAPYGVIQIQGKCKRSAGIAV